MSFAGSVFFTDSKFLQHQTFLSAEYDLPLFINSKFLKINPEPRWRAILRQQMRQYRQYYKTKRKNGRITVTDERVGLPVVRHRTYNERFEDSATLQLPPTRYTVRGNDVADIVLRQTGTKGPYACFTVARDSSTIIGHATRSKFKGSRTMFYNVTGGIERLLHPRNYFRMKIRHGSRDKQVPYLRCMLQDLTLCPRDPKHPGPANYYPSNHCLHVCPKTYEKPKRPGWFFPRSCVPQNDRFWVKRTFVPGPGRYTVCAPVACPCAQHNVVGSGSQKCDTPHARRIVGHGHTWVFRSVVQRLLSAPSASDTKRRRGAKQIAHMEHDAKYMKMITDPVRNTISLPTIDFSRSRPPTLRFNSMERPPKRSKLRNNKKICFMSGCARFPIVQSVSGKSQTELVLRKSPNIPVVKAKAAPRALYAALNAMAPFDRLQVLPQRYAMGRQVMDKSDRMRYTFAALPPPRILIEGNVGRTDGISLEKIYRPHKEEHYYKDEFQATVAAVTT